MTPRGGLDDAADVEHNDGLDAPHAGLLGYLLQHVALFSGEFEIGGLAVAPFTGLTSDGDEGDVGAVERLRDPFALQGHLFEGAASEEFLHEAEACGLVAVGVVLGPAAVFRL